MTEVFNQWQGKYPELVDGKNDAAFLSQGYKLYYDTINDLDTVRPQASKALSTLTSFTQGNATDEDMQSLANDFVSAPPEDRQKIYKYVTLAAQAGQIDRAGIEQFAVNMGQAFTRGFDFVPQGTLQMQEAGVNNWLSSIRNGTQIWVPTDGDLTKAVVGNAPSGTESDAWRQATVPEAETLIQSGQSVRESFKVVRELRNVAKTGVDPIRPVLEENSFWGTAERGAYGLAGSIPLMGATAVNPYLGVLAYQATEYDRIMLENPDVNPQFAQGLALVEGAANAAIDRVQLSSLSGKLPMFGRYLDRIASDGVRRTVKIGANVVEQNLQEGAQDLIAPVLETAVAALREDMPDKDFTSLMDEWAGQRAETFFATLPLALIGGGVATYQDIKNPSAELNATRLRQVGFDKEQVTFIQRAENPEEYDARIQMEWDKRTPENIEAGRQEILNTIAQASTPGENDARISEKVAEDGTRRWVVTAPDGKELLQTKDQQAALEAVRQHSEAQMINERNTVADMVDYFRAQDPTNTATIEAPRTVQQELDRLTEAGDSKGIANLNERIRFAGIPEGADLTTYNILGEANVETTAEGVFRGVIKLRENSRPEDAFEEINHVFVRKAIAEGRVDLDSLRGWLTQTSEATGETYATETETEIIENIAKVGMDYAAGRIEETSLPASFVDYIKRMLQVFKEAMARAIKLKDAFATGKIDSNFESFLADSVGLNQQARVDTARERVSNEVLTDTNFSIGNVSRVDEKGIHPFAKPRPSTYSNPNESEFDPSAILETLVRGSSGAVSEKRWKHGRTIAGHAAFVGWARASKKTIDPSIFGGERQLGSGGEHLVYKAAGDRVYKLTKPGLFGIQADDAGAYLQRWALANRLFNDDARVEGIVKLPGESDYRTVVSHRHIDGRDSTRAEIQDYLQSHGFVQVESQWIHPTLGIAALDAETAGNSITMPDGTVAPVDLNLQPASPQYLQQAREQTGIGGKTNFSIGLSRNSISQVSDKDDPFRVGTAKLGTSKVPKDTPQDSNVSGDNVPDDLLAKQMEKMNYAHLPKNILSEKDPKKKRRKLINWFKKNLLALHDAFPEELRARATHWYDGANRIAKEMGSQFKASTEQASGVIAVFSPQKDWFMNVAQAEQFMELWTNSQDVVLEESLVRAEIEGIIEAATVADKQKRKKPKGVTETKEQTAERREYNKALDERAKVDRRKKVEQVIGKTIRQLDAEPDLQGWAIRVLAQITFGRNYRNLSPEGDRLGMATNDNGALAKNGWGSINEIEKAVRIMKDGSLKNISDNLGNEHKVRNFYNNIAAPNTPYGDATIDTHAVAAAHLMPYGSSATEVGHNFGSGMNGSEVLGISGVYHLYLDAYREAAADRGILPRQMQSITWEAIRLAYPAATKNATTLAKSQKTWKDLTDDSARNTLVGGRIPSPVWAGANDNRESQSNPTGLGENIGQEGVSGGGLLSGVRPTGAGRDGGVNFSIASQSEIDRVNRALGGMNRGPDARLAVYERAKQKFSTLIQSNQQSLDNLRAGTVSFRRTQLLQALGELDAILSIFPPDIRGRVGGYTRLASIAPHDVFKDGEKVSEVSGMKGALISAWMDQGLNIGQAGQQTELPPGYTAKENLGTARSDKAIADFFKKRIEMIDRELEKTLRREYDKAFRKLLDRTKPKKAAPGEKPKGIGGDIQDLFAVVRDSVDMSATDVAAHIAGLDAKIASGELTAEQEARAQVEAALVALTGDWKNADADRRRTALMEATRIWSGAYAAHAQKVIQQREEREIARAEAIVATGKAGELAGRKSKAIADSGLKGSWKDYILNLLNFDQVVGVLFGENSKISNTIIDKQRRAENAKEDGSQAKMQELEDFFTGLAGGKVLDGERLRYRLTRPSMTVDGIEMSELEALSAVMMWSQEDGRRHMEGEMDEAGRPSGKWHYNQAFVDEILANLSTEALALRDWLGQRYANEYANINAVYSELNGVNLPQIRNYSPVTVQPVNAPTGQVLDPVSGSAMSGASTSPGALRTRGTAIAEPRFQDVLQTYISHTLMMEHWKSFAPMIAEANGILRNRDVQNSVEEKGGAEARKMLNAWLDYFSQGGTRDAGAHLALNQGLNNVLGRASQVALVGRASTLLIQSTQLGAALAEMPVKAYLKRMGKLLTGQLGWTDAINSDYIQRRVKQMPPVVQMAMQGLKGAKPTEIQQAGKRLGMLLSGADGLFTAGTYAITYDYHLTKAKELGLAGQEAEDYARNTAERVTDRIAQPTRAGARSLYENTSTNPLARAGWAFASEARKNLALVAYSFAERDTATKMRTLAYVVALNAIGSAILRSIWRDILDDEDEELFDDKYWSPKRIAMAIATEPFYGFPVLGSVVQEAVYKSFGEYKPAESLFSVDRAVGPIKRLPDHLSGDTDMREVMRDIDMVISSLGIMHPNIAATASITHLAKDLFSLGDSAVDAVTED